MHHDCLFCKIAHGHDDKTQFLYENEALVVFKDIKPHAPVHWLIVPKKHIRSVNNLTDQERPIVSEMVFIAQKMADKAGVAASGYKLLFNVEKGGGQMIFHLHLHLLGGWQR